MEGEEKRERKWKSRIAQGLTRMSLVSSFVARRRCRFRFGAFGRWRGVGVECGGEWGIVRSGVRGWEDARVRAAGASWEGGG